jgi:hypothetical protein
MTRRASWLSLPMAWVTILLRATGAAGTFHEMLVPWDSPAIQTGKSKFGNYVFVTQLGAMYFVFCCLFIPPPQHLSNFWVCKNNLKIPVGPHFRLIDNRRRRRRFCPLVGDRALKAMFLISDSAPGLILSCRCPFWAFAAFKALVETTRTLGAKIC